MSIPVGTSLLIGVMPSTDGQSLQGLQDRIEKSRHPARLLSAKEPATSLNLLQVRLVAGFVRFDLHGFWGMSITEVLLC